MEVAEVARVEEAAREGGGGGLGVVVVAAHQRRGGDEDLAHAPLGQGLAVLAGDLEAGARDGRAHAHELDGERARRAGGGHAVALEGAAIDDVDARGREELREGHGHGGLGESVDREEGLGAEAEGSEGVAEAAEEARGDRLGADHRALPGVEAEAGLGGAAREPLHQRIGRGRRRADRRPRLAHGLEPGEGPRAKVHGREHAGDEAVVEREEQAADEAHVVVEREPRDGGRGGVARERAAHASEVLEEPIVGEHDAARPPGAAAGELDQGRRRRVLGRREARDRLGREQILGREHAEIFALPAKAASARVVTRACAPRRRAVSRRPSR